MMDENFQNKQDEFIGDRSRKKTTSLGYFPAGQRVTGCTAKPRLLLLVEEEEVKARK